MKRLFFLFFFALTALIFAACSDEGNGGGVGGDSDSGQVQKVKAFFYNDGIQIEIIEGYAGNFINLPTISRNGYTFNGWKVGTTSSIVKEKHIISADTDFTSDFTLNAPIEIRTPAQLENIKTSLDRNYRLMEDIDLSDYSAGTGWIPIGSKSSLFTGVLEGNGKKIYNLTINDPSNDYVGLFGYVSGARIADLTVELVDAGITGKTYAGGIVGYATGSSSNPVKIVNSHTKKSGSGSITVSGSSTANVGGIVGSAADYVTIIGCSNETMIIASHNAGGIAGYDNYHGSIYYSWNTGEVESIGSTYTYVYAGGIVGYSDDTLITNSHNIGEISATTGNRDAYAGGINGIGGNISNSYNIGYVRSVGNDIAYAGGITGKNSGNIMIRNYNKGDVYAESTGTSARAGGISGDLSGSSVNSYNTGKVSATTKASTPGFSYYAYSGGIAGYQSGGIKVSGNYNTGEIIATSDNTNAYSGGILGHQNSGSISENYNIGDISATTSASSRVYAAGIVGYQYGGTISGNYNTGDITATSTSTGTVYAAGIAGYMNGSRTITKNAAANSNVTGSSLNPDNITINRILAYTSGTPTTPLVNFALDTMSATFFDSIAQHGTDKTDTELKTESTYSADTSANGLGWKFGNDNENPWKMPEGSDYPLLYWQTD
jgi:hypothetical protein